MEANAIFFIFGLAVCVVAICVVVLMLWFRVGKLEDTTAAIRSEMSQQTKDLTLSADRRSSILHNRINPMVETMSGLKGAQEAFVQSFDNFTEVMKRLAPHAESREERTERLRRESDTDFNRRALGAEKKI